MLNEVANEVLLNIFHLVNTNRSSEINIYSQSDI